MKVVVIFGLILAASVASKNLPSAKFAGGKLVKPDQFPFQVGLQLLLDAYSEIWCGGSLIHKRWVLTAAHCVDGVSSGRVYLGATNRTFADQQMAIDNIFVHPKWHYPTVMNDIALIKLSRRVKLNSFVQLVKLPEISNSYPRYVGADVIASGLGAISGSLRVIPNAACKKFYGNTVRSSNICLQTTGGVSTCSGDSGGPLVLNDDQKTQIGITSFGYRTHCQKNIPVLFTRVSSYLDWIAEVTGSM